MWRHLWPCVVLASIFCVIFSQVHARSARRLLDLCCANRGTYIKVGQHLGALEYLLPPEYTSTLSVLHSRAPSTPLPDVLHVIQQELGKEVRLCHLVCCPRRPGRCLIVFNHCQSG